MNSSVCHYSADKSDDIARIISGRQCRVMLFGQPGVGKSTLLTGLARGLSEMGTLVWGLGADPGSPAFGIPGTVCLARWEQSDWSLKDFEALCTLDAARFRLPLVSAVRHLAARVSDDTLLLDAPGVTRGVAGAELLIALVEAAGIDLVLVLQRPGQPIPLSDELHNLDVELIRVQAVEQAKRPGKSRRDRQRTRLWDRYLENAVEQTIPMNGLQLCGTSPRLMFEGWQGKQVAFIEHGRTLSMGEVLRADETSLAVSMPVGQETSNCLLVRDAWRDGAGLLNTSKPLADKIVQYLPPSDLLPDVAMQGSSGERPVVHIATAMATLVNGVFGDPLLHLRLRHQRHSLLFDLGEGSRLPARIAHQVSDVFISHAHMDHICGFLWLLRSRIGVADVCRLYGPAGLASNISGFIAGIHWDRISDRGPRFEVTELHTDRLRKYHLQVGMRGYTHYEETPATDGVLLVEPEFRVRAVILDHGTPVLAYAYEPEKQFNVRKDRLLQRKLEPGPWLNELKRRLLVGEHEAVIELPDGSMELVGELATDLILESRVDSLVYATDFADNHENRSLLIKLAQGAHTLFCEATFVEKDREQAVRTGHLTTKACGEIATQSRVKHLIPFHFSRRYEDTPWLIYREIAAECPKVVMPKRH